MRSARSQAAFALVVGVVATVAGAFFVWGDLAVNQPVERAAAIVAVGICTSIGTTFALVKARDVDPDELADRWKL